MVMMMMRICPCIFLGYEFLISGGVWLADGIEIPRSMLHVHGI